MQNGKPNKFNSDILAGTPKDKSFSERQFPVHSLEDVLGEIRRNAGTGKLEINFKNGYARGEAKWRGVSRKDA
jgi:hypothetical protein